MGSQLTEKQKQLLLHFKDAIAREQGAQELYACMAESCEDPAMKLVFESFRLDEHRHEEVLLQRYNALRLAGDFSD